MTDTRKQTMREEDEGGNLLRQKSAPRQAEGWECVCECERERERVWVCVREREWGGRGGGRKGGILSLISFSKAFDR